jgi:hypothetical protein
MRVGDCTRDSPAIVFERFVNPFRDRLQSSDVSSTLRDEPMLITVNNQTFLAEAAMAATDLSRRQSVDAKRPVGHSQALAGRRAS